MTPTDEKLISNIRKADTEDLLDRVTAYRAGLEPDAVDLIEQELRTRGINARKIADRRDRYERECLFFPDGTAKMCSRCRKPAIHEGWAWHRLLWAIPIFPIWVASCEDHKPADPKAM